MNTTSAIQNVTQIFEQALAYELIAQDMAANDIPAVRNRGLGWMYDAIRQMNEAARPLYATPVSQPTAQTPATPRNWRNDPASPRQIAYLRSLNVNLTGRNLTKGQASMAIDLIKSGNGIGSMGLFFTDGSN